jgi:glycosyltransferase involved in cell wall biosynthesis
LARVCCLDRTTIAVLNNPVVTAASERMRREPVDHPWLRRHDRPVALAVGRLMPQKNHRLLVRAFARVRESTDARLVILGDGPLRGDLERLVHELGLDDHVSMPGFCPNPYPAMAASDVFVLPSAWEGSPGVLIEAMATGTPVVATDCPSGPREILDDGRHGRLVALDDEEALARAVEDALCGRVTPPPEESWRPYDEDRVVDTYLDVLLPGRRP